MSTNNYYQLYIDGIKKLAETIVIKSSITATSINKRFTDYGLDHYVDPYAQNTWKYYLNISGQYHQSDEMMTVRSSDTLEIINFTKDNLVIHRATMRAHQYGTRQYTELVNKYPEQEMLILGILYPVDIDKAIAAPDNAILGYPPELVEPNEYTLISNLQKWIDGYSIRWNNVQYQLTDPLYAATMLAIMYANLIPVIQNIRLQACKTNEAHSYHVKQYLASHGLLDVYIKSMTLKQTLFIYRNIAYIERNSGQKNIFEWLTEHILTERRLPLSEYNMLHDTAAQTTDLRPTLFFENKNINGVLTTGGNDTVSLDGLLDKQDPVARQNALYRYDEIEGIKDNMLSSRTNELKTKTLESSLTDYSKSYTTSLEETLLNHWLALSANGRYTATVNITNPKTGEKIPLSAKDAYVFLMYAYAKSVGITPDKVPAIIAKRVQNIKLIG